MGIFLAYLLAVALVVITFRIVHSQMPDTAAVSWASVVVYVGLAAGLLWTVFRYVRRKW